MVVDQEKEEEFNARRETAWLGIPDQFVDYADVKE